MSEPAAGTDARPTDLQVEYERAPTNVDPTTPPLFSWRVATDRRGARQTACRLVVGDDPDDVAEGVGTVWDSGRVASGEASHEYDGPKLGADETYYWSVNCWTDAGETGWARPQRFATALAPEDWRGEWVAHQPGVGDSNGWRSRWHDPDAAAEPWVQVDLGDAREIASVELYPADPVTVVRAPDDYAVTTSWDGDPLDGFGFPESYRIEVADGPDFADSTVIGERETDEDTENGQDGTTSRTYDGLDTTSRYVRVTATGLQAVEPSTRGRDRQVVDVDPWACFALAGLTVQGSDGADLARDRPVAASSSVETDTWSREHLVNGHTGSRLASTSPLLRTEFTLDRSVQSARLHVAAVGYGECYLNGERLGDRRLDPAWTDYESRVLYASHDVGDALAEGENALGLWLGRGWFAKRSAHWLSDGSPRARVHLTVEYADGTTRTVASDGNWRATASPLVENDIYDGETYDARRERDGWHSPDFDDGDWDAATVVDAPGGTLRPERIEPMGVVETLSVDAIHEHPDGPILDFGQNLTGWVEIEIDDPEAGDEITLRHAEALTGDDDLSTTDLRSADATDTYVARGAARETYEPRFTYHGFRYAQVSGYPGKLDPADVTAKVVTTTMDRRGEFACSNEELNRVQHNAVWGLRANTHSIPEDCPQRDERFGWTGDAQISTRSLLYNFDAVRFEEKWTRDHDDAASEMGYVTDVIPDKATEDPADPTWSITRVVVPWYCYRHDGDRRILRDHYAGMRDYVDYWLSATEDGILPAAYGKYGDWLAFENTDPEEPRRGLPHDLFNTAFLYQVTATFAKIADVLGTEADAAAYGERAAELKQAFDEQFFDREAGVYGPGTQSSFAVPLFLGLVPDEDVDRVAANLADKVREDDGKLKSGFLGTRPLVHTLAAHGYADLAYEVVSQPERPGWVYMVRNGATTMWERWNSDDSVGSGMNSLNHSPFTHVSEFFYEVLAGIRIGDRPVTEHVTIAPALVEDLAWVEASVETRNRDLAVEWERKGSDSRKGGYELSVTVPWNGSATVRLPDAADAEVTESGVELHEETPAGVRGVKREDGTLVVTVGAGEYEFTVE